jgi:hypothetical protein
MEGLADIRRSVVLADVEHFGMLTLELLRPLKLLALRIE